MSVAPAPFNMMLSVITSLFVSFSNISCGDHLGSFFNIFKNTRTEEDKDFGVCYTVD